MRTTGSIELAESQQASTLVSLHPRINLSPFTKDFRGEEHYNESIDLFFVPHNNGADKINIMLALNRVNSYHLILH